MATIKIKNRKETITIGYTLAEDVKRKWFIASQSGKLDQTIDLGEWAGPFRKIDSIDLHNTTESEKVSEMRLAPHIRSKCCTADVWARNDGKFECLTCNKRCELLITK